MFEIASNATVENGKVNISASVNCPTGGYALEVDKQKYGEVLVISVTLRRPVPGEMVTQACTTPTADVSYDLPEGINRVCVFIEPKSDPAFDFEL